MKCKLKWRGVSRPTPAGMELQAWLALLIVLAAACSGRGFDAKTVANLYSIAGIRGGVVVHLGVEDGKEIMALRSSESFLVQGLEKDRAKIGRVREYLSSQGIQGQATIREFDGRHLPYIDNLVNLVVVDTRCEIPDAVSEILRVLTPRGVALVM